MKMVFDHIHYFDDETRLTMNSVRDFGMGMMNIFGLPTMDDC